MAILPVVVPQTSMHRVPTREEPRAGAGLTVRQARGLSDSSHITCAGPRSLRDFGQLLRGGADDLRSWASTRVREPGGRAKSCPPDDAGGPVLMDRASRAAVRWCRQATSSSAIRLRVRFWSSGTLGPIVVVTTAFTMYRPFEDAGLSRSTSSRAAA